MGLLEMFTEMSMIIPATVAIGTVALTVLAIFWFGLGKTRTFEEAKALASKQADLVLQEEYRNSPRAKKGRRQFPRKKKWEESQQEESGVAEPPKGILKSVVEPTPEKSPRSNRVEFNIDLEKDVEADSPRTNPPTPHPKKSVPPVFKQQEADRTAQPLFEEPEEELPEPVSKPPPAPMASAETKKTTSPPKSSKSGSSLPKTGASAGGGGKKKSRAKKEGEVVSGGEDGLSVTRITEIVGASPLTDDDIQQLLSVLLEKMNTNSEWEAANMRSESVKSLKKQNQELLQRCSEAEHTVQSHHSKIKELRAEIQNERLKQQATDVKLQAKITSHSNDMSVIKSRLSGLEEENKTLKARSTTLTLGKLEEDNEQLRGQIHQLTATTKTLSSQVKDTSEENVGLKTELARVKEVSSVTVGGKAAREGVRLTELEGLVRDMEQEKEQLQLTMQALNDDNSRLKASAQANTGDVETLKAKTVGLEASNSSLTADKTALLRNVEQLMADNETLTNEKLTLVAEKASLAADKDSLTAEKVRLESLSTADSANADAANETLKTQYDEQLAGVRREMSGKLAELEGRCEEREKEVVELTAQIEKCSSLKDQLSSLSAQLSGEQSAKKELEVELTALKDTAATDQTDSVSQGELARVTAEKNDLADTVKQLEEKLIDIKDKNNTLRDSLWKAKDEAAEQVKVQQAKLKEAYQKSEAMCKAAKKETKAEAWERQRSFLVQLFPTVTVEESDPAHWLDAYEVKVQALISDKDQQVTVLESKVNKLQETEQKSIQEAERLRNTMETTMGILERLQSEVEGDNVAHQKSIQEKDEMIERERATNRSLQEELKKERDNSSSNEAAVERAKEAESLLQETKQLCQQETNDLRQALTSEQEAKNKLETDLEEAKARQVAISTQLTVAEEEKRELLAQVDTLRAEIEQLKVSLARKATTPPPQVHTEV